MKDSIAPTTDKQFSGQFWPDGEIIEEKLAKKNHLCYPCCDFRVFPPTRRILVKGKEDAKPTTSSSKTPRSSEEVGPTGAQDENRRAQEEAGQMNFLGLYAQEVLFTIDLDPNPFFQENANGRSDPSSRN